jgi:quinohemoprotein amine dehydrogenase
MSTNNAGNLKVIAEVEQGGQALKGEGQLIVTIQRWNNPPLP